MVKRQTLEFDSWEHVRIGVDVLCHRQGGKGERGRRAGRGRVGRGGGAWGGSGGEAWDDAYDSSSEHSRGLPTAMSIMGNAICPMMPKFPPLNEV